MKEKIIELRKKGYTYREIKKELSCSVSTISYHCSKLKDNDLKIRINISKKKIKSFLTDNLSEDKIKRIVDLRKKRKTYEEISKIENLNKYQISKICKTYGLVKVRKYFGDTVYSKDEINKIRELYSVLKSTRKVSTELNISRYYIMKYVDIIPKKRLSENDKKIGKSKSVIEWRKRKKIELVKYKGGKCEKCGYNKCIYALEFHHLYPNDKDFTISGKSWSFERLKKEVDKCIMVCSNCHTEIHHS